MASFNSLPPEIHAKIMIYLDYRSLLQCALTCKSVYVTSKSSSELQYIVELAMDGMMDAGTRKTPVDLISDLHNLRVGWENVDWKRCTTMRIGDDCLAYELVGGVFAMSNGLGLKTVWLPSSQDDPYSLDRPSLGLLIRDFAIDPTQDLVAILEDDHTPISFTLDRRVRIHVRTISTNERHDQAENPILSFEIPPDPDYGNGMLNAMLQIAYDIVALFISKGAYSAKSRVLIWNWQKGTLIYDSEGPTESDFLPRHIRDFSLLSRSSFILTSALDNGALLVYLFSPLGTSRLAQPMHSTTFHLPPIQMIYRIQKIAIHSGPFHAHPPKNSLFFSSPHSSIQVVSITYTTDDATKPRAINYSLFVHNRTLSEYSKQLSESHSGPKIMNWEDWGEMKTRFMPTRTPMHWLRYVHGQRIVCSSSDHFYVDILNFNYTPGRKGASRIQDLRWEPSSIYPRYLFQEGLITRLPYYVSTRTIPDRFYACMIDGERLIGLKMEQSGMELHVYSF